MVLFSINTYLIFSTIFFPNQWKDSIFHAALKMESDAAHLSQIIEILLNSHSTSSNSFKTQFCIHPTCFYIDFQLYLKTAPTKNRKFPNLADFDNRKKMPILVIPKKPPKAILKFPRSTL